MRRQTTVRCFAAIIATATALLTSAPAQAGPDCPDGQVASQDCTGDSCGPVHTRCAAPNNRPEPLVPPPPLVDAGIVAGVGI